MNVEINHEQAADLAALEGMAAETAPGNEAGAAPVVDPAESWAMLPAMLGSMLALAMPELKAVYSEDACRAWGAAMVPVADQYGWNVDEVLGPKMALAMASAPFVIGTGFAIKARKAAVTQQAAPARVENPGINQKTIIFGSPDAAPLAQ